MPITFSKDGFLGTISSSNNDIFITTQDNSGSIHLGTQLELTASKVIEKDFDGKKRKETTYGEDGKVTEQKFDSEGKETEAKVKDPSRGKEFIVSGSADVGTDDNRIEFEQNANGAFISVSGSLPGFNVINASRKSYRLIRETQDQYIDLSNQTGFNLWTNGIAQNDYTSNGTNIKSGSFVFSAQTSLGNAILILSKSGDVRIPGKLYAQEYHTEMVSSSIIYSSGSTQFGNSADDRHLFQGLVSSSGGISASGDIYASGHISASGTITGNAISLGEGENGFTNALAGRLQISSSNDIMFDSADDYLFKSEGSTIVHIKGDESTLDVNGDLTTDSHITASGNISSSGNIFGKQYFPTWHQYNDTTAGEENFIPSPSGYIVESTSINYYRQWLAPYNGKLVKAIIRPGSACGDTVLKLYVNGSVQGTTAATDVPRFNAVTFTDFSESSGVTTFSAGNVLAFSVTPTNSPTDVNICLVWEYDIGS